jgi:hypothetical protein
MTSDAAASTFADIFPMLRSSWQKSLPARAGYSDPDWSPSVWGAMLQCKAAGYFERALASSRVKSDLVDLHQRKCFVFPERGVLCLKKVNGQFQPSGNDTDLSDDYYEQRQLPGIPNVPHFVCGCIISENEAELIGVYFIHTKSRLQNNWVFEVGPDGPQDLVDRQPLGIPGSPLTLIPRIRPSIANDQS